MLSPLVLGHAQECIALALWKVNERQHQLGESVVVCKEVRQRHPKHGRQSRGRIEIRLMLPLLVPVDASAGNKFVHASLDSKLLLGQPGREPGLSQPCMEGCASGFQ